MTKKLRRLQKDLRRKLHSNDNENKYKPSDRLIARLKLNWNFFKDLKNK